MTTICSSNKGWALVNVFVPPSFTEPLTRCVHSSTTCRCVSFDRFLKQILESQCVPLMHWSIYLDLNKVESNNSTFQWSKAKIWFIGVISFYIYSLQVKWLVYHRDMQKITHFKFFLWRIINRLTCILEFNFLLVDKSRKVVVQSVTTVAHCYVREVVGVLRFTCHRLHVTAAAYLTSDQWHSYDTGQTTAYNRLRVATMSWLVS